jgi:hypothetical protein
MNKDTDVEFYLGRLSVDNGVKISSSGIYDCVNNKDGSVQWRDSLYFEFDRSFNLFWEKAVDMLDCSKGVILHSICHVPSPVFIFCER